ncbi:hypothetical protein ACFVVM_13495 [Nocardia sp. NPDC058176]|uniref:hypothetical protein n=1 Tax=Nocardia sp. NPDC058176 TaxID=3346368 RepID=UPI0036DD3BC3
MESIADGDSTAGFFAVIDSDGTMVGGMRVHGPHLTPDEIAGFQPWIGTAGEAQLRAELVERIPLGVVETKGAWSRREPRIPGVGALLARAIPHAAWLLDARYVFGASPLHCLDIYRATAAQVPAEVSAVAYPDERYVTVPVWWDRDDLSTAAPDQHELIVAEREQLVAARKRSDGPGPT